MQRRWETPQNFFWHLLMNLTNNYLRKKLLNWANKKRNNFNIYNIVFSLKKPQRKSPGGIIILQLCNKNVDDMIQSSGDMEHDGLKLAILAWGYLEQI